MKHRLDKYFEDHLKHQSHDVQAEDWAKMSAMLQEDKESKKPILWIWLLGSAMILGALTLYTIYVSTLDLPKVASETQDIVKLNELDKVERSTEQADYKLPDAEQPDLDLSSKELAENSLAPPLIAHVNKLKKSISTDYYKNGALDNINNNSFSLETAHKVASESLDAINSVDLDNSKQLIAKPEKISKINEVAEIEVVDENSLNLLIDHGLVQEKLDILKINPLVEEAKLSLLDISMINPNLLADDEDHKFDSEDEPMSRAISLYGSVIVYPFTRSTGSNIMGYRAGLRYSDVLSNQFGWSAGIGLRQLSGNYEVAERSSVTMNTNSFGWDMEFLSLTPTQIYYLEVPLAVHYKKHNHFFSLGINANMAFASRGIKKSEKYNQTELVGVKQSQVASSDITEDQVWMSTSSFNPVYAQLSMGYKYQVLPSVKLGLGLEYGLNKISKTDLLLDDKSWLIQFGTEINLWK